MGAVLLFMDRKQRRVFDESEKMEGNQMEDKISVRELVVFILRSGDIDDRFGTAPDTDAMLEGGRVHRKIQSAMKGGYQSEVPLRMEIPVSDPAVPYPLTVTVEGRADGIFPDDGWRPDLFWEKEDHISDIQPQRLTEKAGGIFGEDTEKQRRSQDEKKDSRERKKSRKKKKTARTGKWKDVVSLVLPDSDVWMDVPPVYIDEIKGVYRQVERMREPVPVHLAQAKCYAYIYGIQNDLTRIGVQMTYASLETEKTRRFRLLYHIETLQGWFEALIREYARWARFAAQWKQLCTASAKEVIFPYPWREGQKEVAASVYRTILREKTLFLQAPTGTGKTLSTVFPAVKAIGEGLADRIFYMTAKTITRTVAQESFGLLQNSGLRMKVLTLTAKEKICPLDSMECNPLACPRAKGHYDRINRAMFELLEKADVYDRETLRKHAQDWMVCPFELSLDMAVWSDAVICDYNYVFDPRAKLKRFFAEGRKETYLFLVDEAHNLVERGREMFSAGLYREDFSFLRKKIRPYSPKAARALERCARSMLEMQRSQPEEERLIDEKNGCRTWESLGTFQIQLTALQAVMEAFLDEVRTAQRQEEHRTARTVSGTAEGAGTARTVSDSAEAAHAVVLQTEMEILSDGQAGNDKISAPYSDGSLLPVREAEFRDVHKQLLDLYFQVNSFLEISDRLDDNYIIYSEMAPDGRFLLRLYCVDISKNIQETLEKGRSTVFFSATLLPVRYYRSLLSAKEDDYAIYAKSTFPVQNRRILIGLDTSSRYTRRGQQEYRKMAEYVRMLARSRPGNYMVFFSSYRMLDEIADLFEEESRGQDPPVSVIRQHPGMGETDREEFLEQFRQPRSGALVGFCVMGGIFGEGIDLREEQLIGAVIAGTGLPQVCSEREILKRFYDGRGEDGFFYAYLCPGMNKVLQSAGRVIRTDHDRGVILLLDDRFALEKYRSMFPAEWGNVPTCTLARVNSWLEDFWKE